MALSIRRKKPGSLFLPLLIYIENLVIGLTGSVMIKVRRTLLITA
jgi:hypothetical protein